MVVKQYYSSTYQVNIGVYEKISLVHKKLSHAIFYINARYASCVINAKIECYDSNDKKINTIQKTFQGYSDDDYKDKSFNVPINIDNVSYVKVNMSMSGGALYNTPKVIFIQEYTVYEINIYGKCGNEVLYQQNKQYEEGTKYTINPDEVELYKCLQTTPITGTMEAKDIEIIIEYKKIYSDKIKKSVYNNIIKHEKILKHLIYIEKE